MARKCKRIVVDTKEFECVYRVLISSATPEGMGQRRTLEGMLLQMEEVGHSKATGPVSEGSVPAYTVFETAVLELNGAEEAAFKGFMHEGVKRLQAWASRPIPGIIDRLSDLSATENEQEE